mmetsp:Transcript_44144/g.141503  ORF Transcript_44144/g.141503 Transcript_44144/m.141503 type:complete len:274 (-) Transcript_44144:274-1095(-)
MPGLVHLLVLLLLLTLLSALAATFIVVFGVFSATVMLSMRLRAVLSMGLSVVIHSPPLVGERGDQQLAHMNVLDLVPCEAAFPALRPHQQRLRRSHEAVLPELRLGVAHTSHIADLPRHRGARRYSSWLRSGGHYLRRGGLHRRRGRHRHSAEGVAGLTLRCGLRADGLVFRIRAQPQTANSRGLVLEIVAPVRYVLEGRRHGREVRERQGLRGSLAVELVRDGLVAVGGASPIGDEFELGVRREAEHLLPVQRHRYCRRASLARQSLPRAEA